MNDLMPSASPSEMKAKHIHEYLGRDGWLYGAGGGMFFGLAFNMGWLFWLGIPIGLVFGYQAETKKIRWSTIGYAALLTGMTAIVYRYSQEPTYEGIVSEMRQLKNGAVIDLDGRYPDQKMVVFIPTSAEGKVHFPDIGEKVGVYGEAEGFRGHQQVTVTDPRKLLTELSSE